MSSECDLKHERHKGCKAFCEQVHTSYHTCKFLLVVQVSPVVLCDREHATIDLDTQAPSSPTPSRWRCREAVEARGQSLAEESVSLVGGIEE